jgi:hypothetical protein
MFRQLYRSGAEMRAAAWEAVFQNGTFVTLLRAIASRILVLEEIPP